MNAHEQKKESGQAHGGGAEHDANAHGAQSHGDANAQAGDAAAKRMAHHGAGAVEDLGELDKPGAVLGHTTRTLAPGASLRFSAPENQIYGVQGVTASKPVEVQRKLTKPMHKGQLGNQNVWTYTLTMAADAKHGEKSVVEATSAYQSRNDPDYHFKFTVVCG